PPLRPDPLEHVHPLLIVGHPDRKLLARRETKERIARPLHRDEIHHRLLPRSPKRSQASANIHARPAAPKSVAPASPAAIRPPPYAPDAKLSRPLKCPDPRRSLGSGHFSAGRKRRASRS